MGAEEIEEEAQVAMDFPEGRDKLTCHRHLMVQLSTTSRHAAQVDVDASTSSPENIVTRR
jgi:hypothetical protein